MNRIDGETLKKKMASITKGAYWFGIFGRMSIFFGGIGLLFGIISLFAWQSGVDVAKQSARTLVSSFSYLIYGWLFLLGRDAFEAVAFLLKESEETV
jgi:hypothetical protein